MGIKIVVTTKGGVQAVLGKAGANPNIKAYIPTGGTGGGSGPGATKLKDLTDVDTSTEKDGDVLIFDGANNKYKIEPVNGGTF